MDDDSGEFMEKAELACAGRSESKMERLVRDCRSLGEKPDSRENIIISSKLRYFGGFTARG